MTDQWTDINGLPISGDWVDTGGCPSPGGTTSIVDDITITGSPGSISSVANDQTLWALVLNDGTAQGDFRLDRYVSGTFIDSPLTAARATGVVTFHDPVMLAADPASALQAATKQYVDAHDLADAPTDGKLYDRQNGAWAVDPIQADAPSDGSYYSRRNAGWAVAPGGMLDAPNDGTLYGRKSAAWAHLTHYDITDWGTYVPVASSTTPPMDGTAAIGTGMTWARADHVHPSDTGRVAKSGDAMTGLLTLSADPAAALGAVTKQYVDSKPLNDNRIINGDMRIDQRNNGAAVSGAAGASYTIDRWFYSASLSAKGTWGRNLTSVSGPSGFPYCLGFQSSSAYASLAGDYFSFAQVIEADMVSDFGWGAAGAQPVTLSFWAYSSLTGAFSASLHNAADTRSYPFNFSIPVANVWTRITITIPGDTAGTWVMSGNAASVKVFFDLGTGATYRGPAGAWASANYVGATGSISVVATNGAYLYLTGVKLEVGSVATPFNRQSLAKSMADCQRYYQSSLIYAIGYGAAGGAVLSPYLLPVVMRANPTVVFSSNAYSNASGLTVNAVNQSLFLGQTTATAAGVGTATATAAFSAEL